MSVTQKQHILSIIERGIEKGFRPEYIRDVLISKGYNAELVDECFVESGASKTKDYVQEPRYPAPRESEPRVTRISSPSSTNSRLTHILAGLCVVLFIALLFSWFSPAKVVEVEKIIEVPIEVPIEVGAETLTAGDLREKLDQFAKYSEELDAKEEEIDSHLKTITGLNVDVTEREQVIEEQYAELQELRTLMKKERKQVVGILVEVVNFILGNTERVS